MTAKNSHLKPLTPLARLDRLCVTFRGQAAAAVDSVSLEIFGGECVALVGESGSGKSLTARALLGLLPRQARSTGQVYLGEHHAPRNGAGAWTKIRGVRTALVPQDALGGLDPLRRIEREVGDALRLHRVVPRSDRRERVVAALAAAGMPYPERKLRLRSDELSGGLRQRALVAAALITDPELIIADEPTTALDIAHRDLVLQELTRRVQAGAGVLLVSHDLASVREAADRVLVMKHGKVIEQGTTNRVFGSPAHRFTRELLAASPAGKPRGELLLSTSRITKVSVTAATKAPVPTATATPAPAPAPAPAPVAAPRLELDAVTAGFGVGVRRHTVLSELSLSVHAGETVGLIGESGSGKTTLIRVALGLHAPESGVVLIDGVDRSSSNQIETQRMRRRIALVPQDPLDSFAPGARGLTVLEDALRAAGTPRGERHEHATKLAAEVHLSADALTQPVTTLSGGQRQRLAIARALARNPELLLLDEPVSALDVTVQARVLDLLNELQTRRGTAYLFVSHDTDVISHMSDRVLRLENGALHAE